MYTGILTEYPNAAVFSVDVTKHKVTIVTHRNSGICRSLRKHADGENVKCKGNPSNAPKNVIEVPDPRLKLLHDQGHTHIWFIANIRS